MSLRKINSQLRELSLLVRKKCLYSRDLLNEEELTNLEEIITESRKLADDKGAELEFKKKRFRILERNASKLLPKVSQPTAWVENLEVVFVAIVIALALRTFILQPFKIPSDSMKPTLFGIYTEVQEEAPNPISHAIDFVFYGATFHQVVVEEPGRLDPSSIRMESMGFPPINVTKFRIGPREYSLWASIEQVLDGTNGEVIYDRRIKRLIMKKDRYEKGDTFTRFRAVSGDYIFVNKLAYHFRTPNRGEIFVFTTEGISGLVTPTTQYYIKRCVGVPGDNLRIREPFLEINGEKAQGIVFDRIHSLENGYNGYTYGDVLYGPYLTDEHKSVELIKDSYWAMGDNSPNSSDSRTWGDVPRKNLVGVPVFVAWPISDRWGVPE